MRRSSALILVILLLVAGCFGVCHAEEEKVYILTGEYDRVKTELDTGYAYEEVLDKNDLHYGWGLGTFYIKGFSKVEKEQDGTPVFYKEKNQRLSLGFDLKQNIDKLDGNKDYKISEDVNGYDLPFEVPEMNFKKGCLIILNIDEDNHVNNPKYYVNYLEDVKNNAANSIQKLGDAGIYRVALDYEITYPGLLGRAYYNNYKIYFEFKVKNIEIVAERPSVAVASTRNVSDSGTFWDRLPKEVLAGLGGAVAVVLVIVLVCTGRTNKKLKAQIAQLRREYADPVLFSEEQPKMLEAGRIISDDDKELKKQPTVRSL